MIVVPPIGPHLGEPGPVAPGFPAQRLLDDRIDKDALDAGHGRGQTDHFQMVRCPYFRIDVGELRIGHADGRNLLPLAGGENPPRHRIEPDIGVETDLVRGVAREHRATAWLGDVTDEKPGPGRFLGNLAGEFFERRDQGRMTPIAVARQPHHLPGGTVDRERLGASQTALGVEADGTRGQIAGQAGRAEQLLGGRSVPLERRSRQGGRPHHRQRRHLRQGAAAERKQKEGGLRQAATPDAEPAEPWRD